MKLHAFGIRGSLPAPSTKDFKTSTYGGNTTCYYLKAGPFRIILDMGSGARMLGNHLMKEGVVGKDFIVLLTHYHSDHIQGIGFCVPLYIKINTFFIHGFTPEGRENIDPLRNVVLQALGEQQASPFFPVPHALLPAQKIYNAHNRMFSETFYYLHRDDKYFFIAERDSAETGSIDPKDIVKITTIPLHHPNGCLGYRVDYMNSSFAFCTDNEPLAFTNNQINTICKDVDLIVLDGQYTPEQLSGPTQTFGHGSPELCVDQAIACGAKKLLITHLDPGHDDEKIAETEKACKAYLVKKKKKKPASVEFAKEDGNWEI
jgi:phosphoribosyl 1,2-cyclic phosphodiesterase